MIELLKTIDVNLFLFLNGHHTPFMDVLMAVITNKYTWIPFYLILLFFAWKKTKQNLWKVLIAVVILITLSDQLSVHLFKNTFQRYRPCHNLELQDKVHLLNDHCGGKYGFVSSHAANTFALSTFLVLFFRNRNFALFMYLWALVVSYSRIYAGVHYPFDILGGAFLGILLGYLVYKSYSFYKIKYAV